MNTEMNTAFVHMNPPERWWTVASSAGCTSLSSSEDGFDSCEGPLAGNWGAKEKICGIYCWVTENGDAYVGQSVNIRNRLKQHFIAHRDLLFAAFQEFAKSRLDAEEAKAVRCFETEFPLRNIKLVKSSATHLPIDDFITPNDQSYFVENGNRASWLREPRREMPLLEVRQRSKLRVLEQDESYALIKNLVTEFVIRCVPRPIATENRFWSVTYFPEGWTIVRVNVGQQEQFTINTHGEDLFVRLLAPIRYSGWLTRPIYKTKSYVSKLSLEKFKGLLQDNAQTEPVRELSIWLARHTTPLNIGSHCPALFQPDQSARELAMRRSSA